MNLTLASSGTMTKFRQTRDSEGVFTLSQTITFG